MTDLVAVTGGAGGIGAAIVDALCDAGWPVVSLDLRGQEDDPVPPSPGARLDLRFDVNDWPSWEELLERLSSGGHQVTHLINCAAILSLGPVEDLDPQSLRKIMSTNFESPVFLSTALARSLFKVGAAGSIVNISSIHAVLSEPAAAPYVASKGALEAISRTMASEWASRGLRVNCIRPGAIRTGMSEPTYTPTVIEGLEGRIPMRRVGEPSEIGGVAAFLLSPAASYITGATITVDGGFSMHGGLPGVAYSFS